MTNSHWRLPITLIFGFFVSLLSSSLSRAGCVEDEAGRKVLLPQELRRIVALAPSITECLFALGLDDEVVGVTEFSNYPPEVLSRPQVGSYVRINLESVLALEPDLVIATRDGNPKQVIDRLTEMGLAVYVVDPRHMEGLFRTLQALGQLLDREDKAQTLVRELRGRLEEIQRVLKGKRHPRVFLQIGIDPLVTVGRGTLQDELIRLAGGVNIAEEEPVPYPVMSVEHILRARPEVIIVSSMTGGTSAERELQRWHQWEMIPAVVRGRFHVINGDLIDRPTPRLLDGLEEMVRLIHPDLSSQIRGSMTE